MNNKIAKTVGQVSSVCHVLGICKGLYVWMLQFVAKRCHSQYLIDKKHNIIREYIRCNYTDSVRKSDLYNMVTPKFRPQEKYNIWVFWYQGINGMPTIVRQCYDRLCELNASNDCAIHLITKENLKDYLSFPDYITGKIENGIITLTHFSDVLRFALLYNYAGFWMDATVWCEKPIPKEVFNQRYWTIKLHRPPYTISVSYMRWSTFILFFRYRHDPLAKSMLNLFLAYWQREDSLIDYLLVDYLLEYSVDSQRECGDFSSIEESNSHLYSLMCNLSEKYNDKTWEKMKEDTWLFKLSYKGETPTNAQKNKDSYYSMILKSIER